MAAPLPITTITSSALLQARLRELDLNGDGMLDPATEVPRMPLSDQLHCTDVTTRWSTEEFRFIEYALQEVGFVGSTRWKLCVPPRSMTVVEEIQRPETAGHVYFLRQIHQGPPGMPATVVDAVDRYQFTMFQQLRALGPKRVFREGTLFEKETGALRAQFTRREWDAIHTAFATIAPEGPTAAQLQLMRQYDLDGATLYALLHEDVTLSPANSRDVDAQTISLSIQGRQIADPQTRRAFFQQQQHVINTLRERDAAKVVTDYLAAHPGETTALVYGAEHQFRAAFLELATPPSLTSIEWSQQIADFMQLLRATFPTATPSPQPPAKSE